MEDKDAVILELKKEIEELKKIIIELRKENADLKEQLRLNSGNSSKPPSSDRYPPTKKDKNANKTRLKRQGFARRWYSPEEVNQTIQYLPNKCDKCGSDHFCSKAKVVEARQVVELPPIRPIVTEHQALSCRCASCGKQVRAHLPPDVIASVFGPKIKALSTLLSGKFHLSKRSIKELFSTFFNIDISLGSIINTQHQASIFLSQPYEEALNLMQKSETVYSDETGWKTKGQTQWLWQASDKNIVVFKIFASRGKKAFQALFGKECIQNLVTDRFRVYSTDGLHQYCWAHLKRDFKRIEQRSGLVSTIGQLMGSLCNLLFRWSHQKQAGSLSEEEFIQNAKGLKEEFHYLFKLGLRADTHDQKLGRTGRFCERLLSDEEKLWAFTENQSLDLTNNLSERNLRPAVLWRKVSFGNQSAKGERFVERILSVVETLKLQKRNLFHYLVSCFQAKNCFQPIPSFVCIN
jgi:transposase